MSAPATDALRTTYLKVYLINILLAKAAGESQHASDTLQAKWNSPIVTPDRGEIGRPTHAPSLRPTYHRPL